MSKADGSIVFVTELDDVETQQKLTRLTKKIDGLQDKISKNKALKLPLVEQAQQLTAELDAAIEKQKQLLLQGVQGTAVQENGELIAGYKSQLEEINAQVARYDKNIAESERELEWSKNKAGELAQKLSEAGYSAEEMKHGIKKADDSMKKFAARLKSVVRSALVFTVITQALRGFRNWLGDVIKATPEASAAMAKLKGALLTMVQPLVNVIIPAFTTLVNVLTAVVSKIAQVFAALAGTTVESSAQAAEALHEQTEALDGTGSAAKKAGKSLASFDEINKLSNSESGASEITPDFSFNTDIDDLLQRIANAVMLIAAGFALWKISDKFPSQLSGIASTVGLVAIAIGGLAIAYLGLKDAWKNGVDWGNLAMIIGGVAVAAWALYAAFGAVGAGIVLIVGGAAMIVTAFKDIIDNGANLQNTLLLIAGIVATGLGFFLLTGSTIPLVIAGIASIVVALLALTGNLEKFMTNLKENILGGLIDFITGVFTGDWEKAWEGVKKIFKGVWNGIVIIAESAFNLIIDGVNWLIKQLNKIHFEIPDWVPGIGGLSYGINIGAIEHVAIPRLAQGAVIPPNREFLAVLGDQKSGTNIETPLPTMIQAFKQALAESNYSGQSEAYLMLDDIQLGKVVYRLNKQEGNRIGVSLVGV